MGRLLAAIGQVPDLALTSPAVRAFETLRIAVENGRWDCGVQETEALYEDVGPVLAELRRIALPVATALVVGHEPTASELASALVGGGRIRLPTGAMACIDLDIESWADLEPGCGELAWLIPPRLAKEGRLSR